MLPVQIAKVRGITIDISSSKTLADSLDAAVSTSDPYFNKLIRILATRCMTQANYFSSGDFAPTEFLHYGLAAPIYTHFTSPIRRYADILVHRCLAASLGLVPLPQQLQVRIACCAHSCAVCRPVHLHCGVMLPRIMLVCCG